MSLAIDDDKLRVRRILQKLEQVRERGLSCFGSEKHSFRLNPQLTEAELEAFENKHRIQLPSDYRTFLKHVGNGGAGPHYGLLPLEECDGFRGWLADDQPYDFLARPCPLYPELDRTPNWRDQFGDVCPYQGTISVAYKGCSYVSQLIITGPFAGRVVDVDAGNHPPYMIREPDFLSWYERWLDELLGGYKMNGFGIGPGGGESDFFQVLNDPQASDSFKAEAAHAFCRLPRLSSEATNRIPASLRHPIAGVRSGVCAIVCAFEIRDAEEEAARLLDDPSSEVRQQAVHAVMKLDPKRWTEAVHRRLWQDADEDVAKSAFYFLHEAGALSKSELVRIIEQSSSTGCRGWAAGAMEWTAEDEDLLIRLLSDSEAYVRLKATQGLGKINARLAVPQLIELLAKEKDENVIGSILQRLGELGNRYVVPILIHWTDASDDNHRLAAIQSLIKIGDDRAIPIVKRMLKENRKPMARMDQNGRMKTSNVLPMKLILPIYLRQSPNQALRDLARKRWPWWVWLILIPLGILLAEWLHSRHGLPGNR